MCGIFMEKKSFKTIVTDTVGMPKDVLLGLPLVTVTGRCEVCVENYRGIQEYTDKLIRIQAKSCMIHICGFQLQIECYNNEETKITGRIHSIEFHEGV